MPNKGQGTSHRFRGASRVYWFYLAGAGAYLALSIALTIDGAVTGGKAPLITGIVLTAVMLPAVMLFLPIFRALAVTNEEIRIPAVFRTTVIPLAEVEGVGLLYRRTPHTRAIEGWFLTVWVGSDPVVVPRFVLPGWRYPTPPGEKPLTGLMVKRPAAWPLPSEDPAVLAASRPGRVARAICDQVLTAQGMNGPLATEHREKQARSDPRSMTKTIAWWSPDGTMGRT